MAKEDGLRALPGTGPGVVLVVACGDGAIGEDGTHVDHEAWVLLAEALVGDEACVDEEEL